MLYLEVEVPSEPVVEGRLLDVTRGVGLQLQPGVVLVHLDRHRDVVRLRHPREPVALKAPAYNR